jgi:hypothetical protein
MPSLKMVVGTSNYVAYQGGGHWSWLLQYLYGLRALGIDLFWIELFHTTSDRNDDHVKLKRFFSRVRRYRLEDRCAVLVFPPQSAGTLESAGSLGREMSEIREIIRSADLLWNFACAFRKPLLSLFKHPVLIDVDPGHLQISVQEFDDFDIFEHKTFLTLGMNVDLDQCDIPTLGLKWHRFLPIVYLPLWRPECDPGRDAAFSSVTQWTWEEFWLKDRILSISKRTAYLRYLNLPGLAKRRFELAANIHPKDDTGDRELLAEHEWVLVDPSIVADSPESYANYIRASRAELLCPKPIFRELHTGWISDRSVCYLASGRPVLAEETGFSEAIPSGRGLIAFRDMDEALSGVDEIDFDYTRHAAWARALAQDVFSSAIGLPRMLAACGV